jgi:H2-forming N5,N10-methylenetetrahydromethanopterin dehydrogenase-like enzyme
MQSIEQQLEEVGFELENSYTDLITGGQIRELFKPLHKKTCKILVITEDHLFMGAFLISEHPIPIKCDKIKDINKIINLIEE